MAEELMTDDEQLETLKRWLAENGPWIAGGLLVGAALFFGWNYYHNQKSQQALAAAAKFDALGNAMEKGDRNAARNIADELKKDYRSTPYADQADLMMARLAVDAGELANAVDPLTRVMNNSRDEELKAIARMRLARVLIDQGKSEEALKLLADAPKAAFGGRFHEIRGDAYFAKKDLAAAAGEYQSALIDADVRGVDHQLIELKMTDIGAGAKPAIAAPTTKVAP